MSTDAPAPASADLPGWRHVYSGKVRDLYVPADVADAADADRMLVIASDRVSAFDHVLSPGIPGKGELLTRLSMWWFDRLAGSDGGPRIPNHIVDGAEPPAAVAGRAMVAKRGFVSRRSNRMVTEESGSKAADRSASTTLIIRSTRLRSIVV